MAKKTTKKKVKVESEVQELHDEFEVTADLVNKEAGEVLIRSLGHERKQFEGSLSSGSLGLDWAIGAHTGGMKWGQVIQLWGEKSAGKTTVALGFCLNCTNQGKKVLYMDLEGTMDSDMVKSTGIDESSFYFIDADGREAANIAERMMRAGNVGLLVIDSIAVWEPEVDPKKGKSSESVDFTSKKVAHQGGFLTQVVKKICRTARDTGTTILCINQVRANLDMFTGGGLKPYMVNALDHAISVSAFLFGRPRGEKNVITDPDGNLIGQYVKVTVDKNKIDIPMKKVTLPLIFGMGIHPHMELLELAQEFGVIASTGGGYISWVENGERICRGGNTFVQMLADDQEFYLKVRGKVIEAMNLNYTVEPVNVFDKMLEEQANLSEDSPSETDEEVNE